MTEYEVTSKRYPDGTTILLMEIGDGLWFETILDEEGNVTQAGMMS